MEITLRIWKPSDAQRVHQLANNEKIARNLRDGYPFPYTFKDAEEYIAGAISTDPDNKLMRAVCLDGDVVGSIGVFRKDDVYRRSAEVGYWLGEPYWGRGIMPSAVRLICKEAFAATDIVRIDAGVFSFNAASGRVLEKAGFTHEATLRRGVFKNGIFCDILLYALLK